MDANGRRLGRGLRVAGAACAVALLAVPTCVSLLVNGRIVARGSVVDADTGAALGGVELRVRRSSLALLGENFMRVSRETETIDGRFDVGCRGCRHLELEFVKAGYHRRRVQIALDPGDVGAKGRVEEGLEVALLREGELVRLEAYVGPLTDGEDARRVLPVGLGPTVHALPPDLVAERAAKLGKPEAVAYVALVAETDADGHLVESEVARRWPVPRHAHLDFGPADGGAIPYAPRARNVREIALEMREAPADGYRRTLPLDPEEDELRYFYVKIGDRYGRGEVTPVVLERTSRSRRAAVHVRLLLSAEPGSRNLETR